MHLRAGVYYSIAFGKFVGHFPHWRKHDQLAAFIRIRVGKKNGHRYICAHHHSAAAHYGAVHMPPIGHALFIATYQWRVYLFGHHSHLEKRIGV
jgi:hypothetical protein